jgi:predicted nucleic acid-binding protein
MEVNIKDISFSNKIEEFSLDSYVDSLNKYRLGLDKALKLTGKIPIFLDTNVLLRYYSISFKSRTALLKFFSKYKEQIVITAQVQREFIKNREDIIDRYFNETLKNLRENYKDDVVNKLKNYIERNKILLDDFPDLEEKLNRISADTNAVLEQFEAQTKQIKEKLPTTKYEDELLAVMKEMKLINSFSNDEIKFLHAEFDYLKKGIEVTKIKSEIDKPQRSFPGLADLIEKPTNPYGDYILYHEMVKYVKTTNKPALFLTYDTSKGDWIKENKEPHSHYIQAVFLATGQNLYFIDAERFFNDHLKQHFESLVKTPIDYYSHKIEFEKEFIIGFVGLERIIRTIAQYVVIEDFEIISITKIIGEFYRREYIGVSFRLEFLRLLQFRNLIVHSSDRSNIESIKQKEFQRWIQRLEKAKDKMNALYRSL